MRILVCGSRDWTDSNTIYQKLSRYPDNTIVIHGACRGADRLAGTAAKCLGMPIMEFPADWQKYGKSAGPIRNQQMLDEGKPDLVIACHDDLENSKGTKDMVARALKAKLPIIYATSTNRSESTS